MAPGKQLSVLGSNVIHTGPDVGSAVDWWTGVVVSTLNGKPIHQCLIMFNHGWFVDRGWSWLPPSFIRFILWEIASDGLRSCAKWWAAWSTSWRRPEDWKIRLNVESHIYQIDRLWQTAFWVFCAFKSELVNFCWTETRPKQTQNSARCIQSSGGLSFRPLRWAGWSSWISWRFLGVLVIGIARKHMYYQSSLVQGTNVHVEAVPPIEASRLTTASSMSQSQLPRIAIVYV